MGKTREDSRAFVNVADFGNPGDGIGSAHQPFLDAIDLARSVPSNGNIVYAPEGVWLLDGGALPIYSNLEYRGAGIARSVLRCSGATTARAFQALSQVYNVRFSHLTLDLDSLCSVGLEIAGCNGLVLDRVRIRRGKDAAGSWPLSFITNPCSNVWIYGCDFREIFREAVSFGAGTALSAGFLSNNRAVTSHSAWLAASGSVEGTDYFDRDNIVTENGVMRITGGGGGSADGPFQTPTLNAAVQAIPNWERLQYYKTGQVVHVQGAFEVKPGQTLAMNDVLYAADSSYWPAKDTPRFAGDGYYFLFQANGDVVYLGPQDLIAGTWLSIDVTYRLGGS
jgi:hypothetical protein